MTHVEIECPFCFQDTLYPKCKYCKGIGIVLDAPTLRLMVKNDWVRIRQTQEVRSTKNAQGTTRYIMDGRQ